jgi:uncharacterized protein (TIGR02996 family)
VDIREEGRALLKAIYKNPDEDTPRLMYADWCEESGFDGGAAHNLALSKAAKCECKAKGIKSPSKAVCVYCHRVPESLLPRQS